MTRALTTLFFVAALLFTAAAASAAPCSPGNGLQEVVELPYGPEIIPNG